MLEVVDVTKTFPGVRALDRVSFALQPGEAWMELGPGLGALTEFALNRSTNGLVIEKDGRLAAFLRERFPELEVLHGDASDFDVRELFARGSPQSRQRVRVSS